MNVFPKEFLHKTAAHRLPDGQYRSLMTTIVSGFSNEETTKTNESAVGYVRRRAFLRLMIVRPTPTSTKPNPRMSKRKGQITAEPAEKSCPRPNAIITPTVNRRKTTAMVPRPARIGTESRKRGPLRGVI